MRSPAILIKALVLISALACIGGMSAWRIILNEALVLISALESVASQGERSIILNVALVLISALACVDCMAWRIILNEAIVLISAPACVAIKGLIPALACVVSIAWRIILNEALVLISALACVASQGKRSLILNVALVLISALACVVSMAWRIILNEALVLISALACVDCKGERSIILNGWPAASSFSQGLASCSVRSRRHRRCINGRRLCDISCVDTASVSQSSLKLRTECISKHHVTLRLLEARVREAAGRLGLHDFLVQLQVVGAVVYGGRLCRLCMCVSWLFSSVVSGDRIRQTLGQCLLGGRPPLAGQLLGVEHARGLRRVAAGHAEILDRGALGAVGP